jgi:hypothetical protein
MGGACGKHGEITNAYKMLVGKPEEKIPRRRPRYLWEINIRMDLRKSGWERVNWMHLAQDRVQWGALVNKEMSFWDP